MSFDSGDVAGLIGLGIVGAVAVKTVDSIGKVAENVTEPKKKKKKSKKKESNIFSMENAFESYDKPKKGSNKNDPFKGITF